MTWNSFWTVIAGFFSTSPWGKLLSVVVIIVVTLLLRWVLHFVLRYVVNRIVNGVKKKQGAEDTQALMVSPLAAVRLVQRTRTLGSVLGNILSILLFIVAVLLIVNTIDATILGSFALLTAALGAGLGFGAQNIVKDVLNGLFMVIEDQLGVGDVVDLGSATGVVESVGIRVTQVRDVNGTLWFVRNGEILRVGNMSQGWARVIVDLSIPYETDVDAAQETILATAQDLAQNPKWRSRILEKPELWGLESISADALIIRLAIKTRSTARDDVARELRARLKKSLDALGVHLPALDTPVLTGYEGAGSVTGSRPPKTRPLPVTPAAPRAPRAPRKHEDS